MSLLQRAIQPAPQPPGQPPVRSCTRTPQPATRPAGYRAGHKPESQALQPAEESHVQPTLTPAVQPATDLPKVSRQVLAHVAGHLQPFGSTFERVEHEGCSGNRFAKDCVSSRIANRQQLDEICLTTFSTASAHLFTCHAFTNTFNYLHVVRKQEDCVRLDCNREAVRLSYCQLERIHARARVDMSMLDTGKTAFNAASGLMVPF